MFHLSILSQIFLLMISFLQGVAQTEAGSSIAGKVRDAESGNPLADAILFLANTSVGTSSDNEGLFLLAYVSAGEYDLIISRVGYVRQSVHLVVTGSDVPSLEIKLAPRPVSIKGVDVLGDGPEEVREKPFLFFPRASSHSYSVYGNNSSLPIGILFTDSALYMCALDTAVVDSEKFVRLWLLFKNLSDTAVEFNPVESVSLSLFGMRRSHKDIRPVPPSAMMAMVPREEAMRGFSDRIEATMRALLLIHQLIKPGYIRLLGRSSDASSGTDADISGRMGIRWDLGAHPALRGMSTPYLSALLDMSEHVGILKPRVVLPGRSVDGFIYFPFPGLQWNSVGRGFDEALECRYELEVLTPSGRKTIVFTAD